MIQALLARRVLRSGLTFFLFTILAAPQTAAQDQGESLEEVVVTGSRIPRPDFVANSPVTVVDSREFELAATVETESILNTLLAPEPPRSICAIWDPFARSS
jgi:outer membrane cobalamin receptor